MFAHTHKSVLILGGSGVVGRRAAAALRHLQPELPITIGGRDLGKANAVAVEIGRADTARIDLEREDLGLPVDAAFSAVVVLLRDQSLNSMKYAQANGLPYVSFSDFAFDIGPEVALYIQRPTSAPVLMLGHFLGGTVILSTLHFVKEFRRIHAIEISAVFDAEDTGGPAAAGDMERLTTKGVPTALILKDGKFQWVSGEDATRSFTGVDGAKHKGHACALLDIASLAAATDAKSIRIDFAVREAASRLPGEGPSHEVIIEIVGEQKDGTTGRVRHEIVDDDVHSRLSARGAALATERLLGLAGGTPVAPGLYHPETLLDPAYVVERLRAFGTRIERSPATSLP